MKYIDWNIKCYCDIEKIIELLRNTVSTADCVVALQEVMPEKAQRLKKAFSDDFNCIYSLDYRPANDAFDTDNRRLGVALLVSKDMDITEAGVFERCLFPERTLFATVNKDGMEKRIETFHSITGVSFKMGKAVQFRSFAECIANYKPDFLSMDANEPQVDHYDVSQMEFFDQGDKGAGARIFFDEIQKQGMVDAFARVYDQAQYKYGEPLTVSHMIHGKSPRRYDFLFVNKQYEVKSVDYLYAEACNATSDHAMIVAEIAVE